MIKKTFSILNNNEKIKFYYLFILIIFSSLLELLGIGIVYPFLLFILDDSYLENEFFVLYIKDFEFSYNQLLIISVIFILIVYSLKNFFVLYTKIQIEKFSKNFRIRILKDLSYKLFNFPYQKVFKSSSDLIIKKINLAMEFSLTIRNLLVLFVEFLTLFLIVVFLLKLNFKISLVLILFFSTMTILIYNFTKKKISYYGRQAPIKYQKLLKELLQSIGGIKEIKLANKENYFFNKLSQTNKVDSYNKFKTSIYLQFPSHLIEMVAIISVLGLILIQVNNNFSNATIISILAVYAVSIVRLMPTSTRVIAAMQNIKFKEPIAEIILDEIKDLKKYHLNSLNKKIRFKNKIKFENKFRFKNVEFKYDDRKNYIFKKLNFELIKGNCVGVFGKSGGGKTTFLNLIMGLLTPTDGKIFLDELELNKNNIKEWQKKIGFVPQNPYFLNDSIKNNIIFGLNKKINYHKLHQAILKSQLADTIKSLPNKINTLIGERGISLSGGQLQRIAIARALYNSPEVLILDEATNSLDEINEKNIFKVINKLKKKITILIVSHDKRNFKICDKVYSLKNSEISRIK